MARWRASATIRPMICANWEAWPSMATSAAEGWLPTTEPIFVSTTSERRCSAVARPPVVARKRTGSAIRQVTRLCMTRFFLSSLRNSAVTGLRVSRRLSSRTTVSKGKGRLTKSPGSFTTRATRPKRRKRPYRSEEHTSELQSQSHISYAVFCLKKKKKKKKNKSHEWKNKKKKKKKKKNKK